MDRYILPFVHGAQVSLDIELDNLSEAFAVGDLSKGLIEYQPTFFERVFGYHPRVTIDESEIKRCLWGKADVQAHPTWKEPKLELWPANQKILIAVQVKNCVWIDDGMRPMLGYVKSQSLEIHGVRGPETTVIVDLQLPSVVADKLFLTVDGATQRTNSKVRLSMELRYTSSYKTRDGKGSGAGLWYPWDLTIYRSTKFPEP